MKTKPTYILGISAFYHDSAACLVRDGEIIAANQEERFSRIKGDSSFPHHAIHQCLKTAGISENDLDYVVFYENSVAKFERLLTTYALTTPLSLKSYLASMPSWLTQKLWMENNIAEEMGINKPVYACDHHLSHAASAFFPSPFQEAAILTVDGVGEWSTTTYGKGRNNQVELLQQIRFPNSLGLLYSAFTLYAGFKINSGEYKLMGLAPYGKPVYADLIYSELIKVNQDGSFVLNQKYFDYIGGLHTINQKFCDLFGGPARAPESLLTQKDMDIAASIQQVLEDVFLRMARHVRKITGLSNLVMAGGVALNVVAAGRISQEKIFDELWIQPASGDAGGALGAALWFWHQKLGNARQAAKTDSMKGSFLGLEIPPAAPEDDELLHRLGADWVVMDEASLTGRIAEEIASGRIVAVARGRAEWGPRALGNRSILGDARLPEMQKRMNLKIKYREGFRPFAPMVLEEKAADYFEALQPSPYMLLVYNVVSHRRKPMPVDKLWGIDLLNVPRSDIPAVTHIDYSARIQTIDAVRNPFMYRVISQFFEKTECPVIVNTSFNVRGEPIVNTAEDAYRCFLATEIDSVVIGNRFLRREEQRNRPVDEKQRAEWLRRFDLD